MEMAGVPLDNCFPDRDDGGMTRGNFVRVGSADSGFDRSKLPQAGEMSRLSLDAGRRFTPANTAVSRRCLASAEFESVRGAHGSWRNPGRFVVPGREPSTAGRLDGAPGLGRQLLDWSATQSTTFRWSEQTKRGPCGYETENCGLNIGGR